MLGLHIIVSKRIIQTKLTNGASGSRIRPTPKINKKTMRAVGSKHIIQHPSVLASYFTFKGVDTSIWAYKGTQIIVGMGLVFT